MKQSLLQAGVGIGLAVLVLSCAERRQIAASKAEFESSHMKVAVGTSAETYSGVIEQIDQSSGLMTVRHADQRRIFTVGKNCEVVTADKKTGKLTDLKAGKAVE